MRKNKRLSDTIISMLKEDTGRHFLDSGGAYGRHWERNQDKDFKKQPACTYSIEVDGEGGFSGLSVELNVYHFLMAHLDLGGATAFLNKAYKTLDKLRPDDYDLQIMESFVGYLKGLNPEANIEDLGTTNTYNFENILSQTLQYLEFRYEGETYILLQVHGGCDVRGGYTKPRIFRMVEPDYFHMSMSDVDIYCPGLSKEEPKQLTLDGKPEPYHDHHWYSDDCGYHWYHNGTMDKVAFNPKVIDDKLYCQWCGKELTVAVRNQW